MNTRENINKKQNKLCKETENGISIKTYEARTIFLNHLEFEKQKDKLKRVPVESKKGKTYHETRTTDDINYYGDGTQELRYYEKPSVFSDCILLNHLCHKGSKSIKPKKKSQSGYYTRDIIIISFRNGINDFEEDGKEKRRIEANELRHFFYEEKYNEKEYKVQIHYFSRVNQKPKDGKMKQTHGYEYFTVDTITYKPLIRTAGQAKTGKIYFIRDELWNKTMDYLSMGIYNKTFGKQAKIVELSAYSAMIVGTASDYLNIPFDSILVVKDDEVSGDPINCLVVEYKDGKCGVAEEERSLTNTLWDGEGLIDVSVFPDNMNGFIYCRSLSNGRLRAEISAN